MSKLGNQIKHLREAAGMSLQDVATRAKLSKAHVWELETGGSTNPTIKSLCCLAIALDTEAAHLATLATEDCIKVIKVEPQTIRYVVD